jgi:hypothetical protein
VWGLNLGEGGRREGRVAVVFWMRPAAPTACEMRPVVEDDEVVEVEGVEEDAVRGPRLDTAAAMSAWVRPEEKTTVELGVGGRGWPVISEASAILDVDPERLYRMNREERKRKKGGTEMPL